MKRVGVLLLFLIFAVSSGYTNDKVKIELIFYAQTYRLNKSIEVLVNVVNSSHERFEFDVSSLIFETFFFEVRTPKNEPINIRDRFQVEMKNNFSASEDYRKIVLEPGESFSRTINIMNWFQINESGYYHIRGVFYPNPDDRSQFWKSSYYKILVKPPLLVEKKLTEFRKKKITRLEEVKKYPPYQVIEDLFDAKMKKDWERFLVHIDAKRLINAFPNYRKEYDNARTGQYQLEVIERFRDYLTRYWQDRIILYKVKKTVVEPEKSEVVCDVKFQIRTVSYTMRYTFTLLKNHEGHWLISDYFTTRIQ